MHVFIHLISAQKIIEIKGINIEEDIIKCYDDIIDLDKNNLESYYKKIEYLMP